MIDWISRAKAQQQTNSTDNTDTSNTTSALSVPNDPKQLTSSALNRCTTEDEDDIPFPLCEYPTEQTIKPEMKTLKLPEVGTDITDSAATMSVMSVDVDDLMEDLNNATHMLMTANEHRKILDWLAFIDETSTQVIAEILERARTNPDAKKHYLQRAFDVPQPPDRGRYCGMCQHFKRLPHTNMGTCGNEHALHSLDLLDTEPRECSNYCPKPRFCRLEKNT